MSVSIVLAGGGCRTFWSLGVLEGLRDLTVEIQEWAGVSAGAAMAVLTAAGKTEAAMGDFLDCVARNPRNVYPERILRGEKMFPHHAIYAGVVERSLAGGGLEHLKKKAKPVRILLAHTAEARFWRTFFGALWTYERRKNEVVHGPEAPYPGIEAQTVTAQDAQSPQQLADYVLTSSSTPPVTELPRRAGRVYIDGGLVDPVPVRALSAAAQAGKMVIFLTRPFPSDKLPRHPRRVYLAPPRPVPIKKWDYTNPRKLEETFAMGRRDAALFRKPIEELLRS